MRLVPRPVFPPLLCTTPVHVAFVVAEPRDKRSEFSTAVAVPQSALMVLDDGEHQEHAEDKEDQEDQETHDVHDHFSLVKEQGQGN